MTTKIKSKKKNLLANYKGPRCERRLKNCSLGRGGCGYRYKKEDYEHWKCPECGFDRHCPNPVAQKGDACRVHGGGAAKANRGVNSPTWKHGRYSKYVPSRLLELYEKSIADPELIALRDEVGLLQARNQELLLELSGTGDSSHRWRELARLVIQLKEHAKVGDDGAMALDIVELSSMVKNGKRHWAIWREIYNTTELLGRTNEREQKRLERLGMMMKRDDVLALFSWFVDMVRSHVTDEPTLAAIESELRARSYHL